DRELHNIDVLHRPIGEQDKRQWHSKRDKRCPQQADAVVAGGNACHHGNDLAAGFFLCAGNSILDRRPLIFGQVHGCFSYQLPEAPPPPKPPPPPPKPPPKPPDKPPPPQPPLLPPHPGPGIMIGMGPPYRPREERG